MQQVFLHPNLKSFSPNLVYVDIHITDGSDCVLITLRHYVSSVNQASSMNSLCVNCNVCLIKSPSDKVVGWGSG